MCCRPSGNRTRGITPFEGTPCPSHPSYSLLLPPLPPTPAEEGCWSTPVVCGPFCCPRLTHHRPPLSWPRNPLEQSSRAPCSGESTACCLVGDFPLSTPRISHSGLRVPSSGKTGIFLGKTYFGDVTPWGRDTQGFGTDHLWNSGQPARRQQRCTPKAKLRGLRDGNRGFSSHRVWT